MFENWKTSIILRMFAKTLQKLCKKLFAAERTECIPSF
jgi:hypothetical protein